MRGRASTLASKAERQERQHDRDGKRNGACVGGVPGGREITSCQEACNVDGFAIPLPTAVVRVTGEKDGENTLVSVLATHSLVAPDGDSVSTPLPVICHRALRALY